MIRRQSAEPFPGRIIRIRKRGCEPLDLMLSATGEPELWGRRFLAWPTFDAWERLMQQKPERRREMV